MRSDARSGGRTTYSCEGASSISSIRRIGNRRRRAIASAANGIVGHELESRWLRADGGSPLDVAWTATPIDDVTGRRASLVLLSGVDVTERKKHEKEIRASRSRIIEAAGEARRKLERNLHDGAQQRLVSLSVSLRLAQSLLESDPDEADKVISSSREELAAALDELRELARGIHPAVLTDRGLTAAIEALVSGRRCPSIVETPEGDCPAPIEAAAYYVVSEAITNIVKYAGASAIEVRVEAGRRPDHGERHGRRMRRSRPCRQGRAAGLRDRLAALDGTLVVDSPAEGGTTIVAEIPLARSPAHREAVPVGALRDTLDSTR